jgi:class 3 adenylate cyclase
MCILFATTYPERTDGLILTGSYAKRIRSDEYPWAPARDDRMAHIEEVERTWGERGLEVEYYAPSRAGDPAFVEWLKRYARLSASPKAAAALIRMNSEIDVTSVLPSVRVPTLLLYREGDRDVRPEEGRYIASKIPGARFVELPGSDHFFWAGDSEPLIEEIEEFMTGHRTAVPSDRVLATVLFTDIVGSTEIASAKGDQAWLDLLDRHHQLVRSQLARWRGREENTAGDGFLATFDGPARAVRCARSIAVDVRRLALEVRCGLHTGEIEMRADSVGGLAVHIGARIGALAGPGEVLVSRTVRDLVSGSGLEFVSRGSHSLKGVAEPWELFAVVGG